MPDSAILWTAACQTLLSMEFSSQGYWRGLLFPTPRDLPNPEIAPVSLMSPVLAGRLFITGAPPGKPHPIHIYIKPLESISKNIKNWKQVIICYPYDLKFICGNKMLFKSKQSNTDHSKFCCPDQSLNIQWKWDNNNKQLEET